MQSLKLKILCLVLSKNFQDIQETMQWGFALMNRVRDMTKKKKKTLHTSKFELEKPLLNGKNKKSYQPNKKELVEKIMEDFVSLRTKTHTYFADDKHNNKTKAKDTKNV